MTHFYILFGIREKIVFFELWISPVLRQDQDMRKNVELSVSPVLMQNQDIWNFYGSLTSNNGKLI